MEFTPLFVLVGIVVTSGFIAYVCDIVGKKLGKKRLSLLGMRPRHTAAIGTVLVGAVISITSICLMIVGSKDAREWIIRGGTAMRDLKIKQQEVKDTEQRRTETQQELDDTNSKLNIETEQLNQKDRKLAIDDRKLNGLSKKLNDGVQRIATLNLKQAELQGKVADFLKKLSSANLQLAARNTSLGVVTKEYNEVTASLKTVTSSFEEIQKQSIKKEADYRQTLADRNEKLAKLDVQRADLERRRDALQAQKAGLEGEVTDLSSRVQSMTDQLVAMQHDLSSAEVELNSWVGPSRFARMVYHYQQEVARIDLPANLTEEQATQAVNTLLDRARIEASQHGAEGRNNYKVADVMSLSDGTTAEQRLQQVVAALVKNPQPIVLMSRASVNTFEKEPVALDLVKYDNPLVYTKGQVVAESKIDGSESRDEVMKQVTHFFSVNLTEKTHLDKMIPDPEDQSAYGTITYDRLYGLVDTVKLKGRQVRLVAKAQTDTHAADPLKLDLEVQ